METEVKREDGKVWIEGVKGFSPADYADSVHGCQARILQVVGESLSYEDLVCYSGFAFRVGVNEDMCPSAGHPCCGFVCLDNGFRALPWKVKLYESMPEQKRGKKEQAAFEAEACGAIRDSIQRGVPVHYGSEEDGLIIGCAEKGRRWWCVHPYHKWGAEPFWHDEVKGFAGGKWPWGIVVWTEAKPPDERVADDELTLAALRQAARMWHEEQCQAYFCGDAAYEHWLNWLRGVDAGEVDEPEAGMQGNGWCLDVLTHCRPIAAAWLKGKAPLFGDEAGRHLLAAAEHYAALSELCMEGLDCSWSLALPPDKSAQWTPAMREEQIKRLEGAREHDRAAVAEIENALDDVGE